MQEKYYLRITLTTLSALGIVVLLLSTRWGIGLSPDSAVYIGAARNLLIGEGFSFSFYPGELTPITHYPPLFPTLLAGIGYFGMDPIQGARWLNGLLFAASIALVGLVVFAFARSFWLSVGGSFLMMISFPIVQIHSMAWSEPLFIFFGLLGISLLALYMEKPKYLTLAAASLAVALGFLTRYAGIALVSTGVIGTLLLSRNTWSKKYIDTVLFSTISCGLVSLWVIRNLVVGGTVTSREINFHPLTTEHLRSAIDIISAWLLPNRVSPSTRWVSLLIAVGFWVLGFLLVLRKARQNKRQSSEGSTTLPTLLGLFVVSYGLVIVVSISFIDAQTPIDNRILSPVYVATLVLVLCLSSNFWTTLGRFRAMRIALIIFIGLFSVSQLAQAIPWLTHSYNHGLGYAGRTWKRSGLMKRVHGLDPGVPIFTNAPDVVYLVTGRPAYMVPSKVNPATKMLNDDYPSELAAVRRELKEHNGVLVYFNKIAWRWYLPSENELEEELVLHLYAREEDGSLYKYSLRK